MGVRTLPSLSRTRVELLSRAYESLCASADVLGSTSRFFDDLDAHGGIANVDFDATQRHLTSPAREVRSPRGDGI
jgi:hypothetical protein